MWASLPLPLISPSDNPPPINPHYAPEQHCNYLADQTQSKRESPPQNPLSPYPTPTFPLC